MIGWLPTLPYCIRNLEKQLEKTKYSEVVPYCIRNLENTCDLSPLTTASSILHTQFRDYKIALAGTGESSILHTQFRDYIPIYCFQLLRSILHTQFRECGRVRIIITCMFHIAYAI